MCGSPSAILNALGRPGTGFLSSSAAYVGSLSTGSTDLALRMRTGPQISCSCIVLSDDSFAFKHLSSTLEPLS